MSWLPERVEGATPLEEVFGLRPDLYVPFRDFYAVFWEHRLLDPVLLDLCRLRVAQLLGCTGEQRVRYRPALDGGLTEEMIERLPQWPTDEHFDARQRAVLAFTEQFVLDPHGIDDRMRAAVREHLSVAALVALTEVLALFDGFQRFRLILGVEGPDEVTVVDAPARDAPLA